MIQPEKAFCLVSMHFFDKNDQNNPHPEPRSLNPLAIAVLKTLTSICWLLKRVSNYYRVAESEKTRHFYARFSIDFTPLSPKK
jgi:hypothetical protein